MGKADDDGSRPSIAYTCNNCRNANRFRLATVRRWFTLFFIPVIPYSTQHIEFCPVCRAGRAVTKQELQTLKVNAAQDQRYLTGDPIPHLAAPPSPLPSPDVQNRV